MSLSGWKALPDVREWTGSLGDVGERSGGPPGRQEMVGRLSRMSSSGREALEDVREWSGGPPGCQGVVGRISRMSGSG